MMKNFKYFIESIFSKAYWQYILFSKTGIESVLSIFGFIYLLVEALDFFNVYKQDKYPSYFFFIFLFLSIAISIIFRRPITAITIGIPENDFNVEIRIGDLFDATGAIVISSNTEFEADVAGGKIASDSLQGQFTAKYFTGNQNLLINNIQDNIRLNNIPIPCPMGTVVPISTHGKTFYLTAMAELNNNGNASTTTDNINLALKGLWNYVKNSGELQELVLPVIGTGRGRLKISRKKMITWITESFVNASKESKLTEKLVIVIRPEDASNFEVNLYDIKDSLKYALFI